MFIILQQKNGVFICVGFYRVSKMFCFQCVQFGFIVLFLIIFLSKFTINNSKSNLTNVGKKNWEHMQCHASAQCNCTDAHLTWCVRTLTHMFCAVCHLLCSKIFSTPSKTLYLFLFKNYSRFFFLVTNTNFI